MPVSLRHLDYVVPLLLASLVSLRPSTVSVRLLTNLPIKPRCILSWYVGSFVLLPPIGYIVNHSSALVILLGHGLQNNNNESVTQYTGTFWVICCSILDLTFSRCFCTYYDSFYLSPCIRTNIHTALQLYSVPARKHRFSVGLANPPKYAYPHKQKRN